MLDIKKLIAAIIRTTIVGEIKPYAGSNEPAGWLKCDGRAVSRETYAALFNAIGTTYGTGDGSTTFNIPDLRDRFMVGAGISYALNAKGGEKTHTLTTNEIPAHTHGSSGAHTHNLNLRNAGTTGSRATNNVTYGASGHDYVNDNPFPSNNGAHTHSSVGGGQAHNNMPPYIGINFLIYVGGVARRLLNTLQSLTFRREVIAC